MLILVMVVTLQNCIGWHSNQDQVRELNAKWLQSYNEERAHEAPGGIPLSHLPGPIEDQKFSICSVSLTEKLTVEPDISDNG